MYDDTFHLRFIRTLKYAPLIFLEATGLASLILNDSTGISYNLGVFGPGKETIIKLLIWIFPLVLIFEVVVRVKGGFKIFK